jgi:alkylhydroperoxidase/carboxymuconolactone decarboxylase family protein YurZ
VLTIGTGQREAVLMKKLIVFLALVPVMIFSLSLMSNAQIMNNDQTLNARQQSIITIAAFTANGNIENLRNVLNDGLDAGLTVNEAKEVLVQLYAY